jgi:hypothetical protein
LIVAFNGRFRRLTTASPAEKAVVKGHLHDEDNTFRVNLDPLNLLEEVFADAAIRLLRVQLDLNGRARAFSAKS